MTYRRPVGSYDERKKAILAAIETELGDKKFQKFTHGTPTAWTYGCRGPLCRKCVRDRNREIDRIKRGRPDLVGKEPRTYGFVREFDGIIESTRRAHEEQKLSTGAIKTTPQEGQKTV